MDTIGQHWIGLEQFSCTPSQISAEGQCALILTGCQEDECPLSTSSLLRHLSSSILFHQPNNVLIATCSQLECIG